MFVHFLLSLLPEMWRRTSTSVIATSPSAPISCNAGNARRICSVERQRADGVEQLHPRDLLRMLRCFDQVTPLFAALEDEILANRIFRRAGAAELIEACAGQIEVVAADAQNRTGPQPRRDRERLNILTFHLWRRRSNTSDSDKNLLRFGISRLWELRITEPKPGRAPCYLPMVASIM